MFFIVSSTLFATIPAVQAQFEWDRYHSYSEIEGGLRSLEGSGVAKMYEIGVSVEGRKIWAVKISDNPAIDEAERKVLFVGLHHAREWISAEVPYYLSWRLVNDYATDTSVKYLVDNSEVWVVPVLNPDGLEYSRTVDRMWRKNRRDNGDGTFGVDLNRNYAYMWGEDLEPGIRDGSPNPSDDTYWGPYAFSEPETRALRDLILSEQFEAVISYHSFGQYVLYPWGYTEEPTIGSVNSGTMYAMAKKMSDLIQSVHGVNYAFGQGSTTLYKTSGDLTDWVYGMTNAPAFTIELRPALIDPQGFELQEEQILPTCEENWPAAKYIIEWAVLYSAQKHVLETEINPFYIKRDKDPWPRPGAADPNFRFNILGYDDDFNPGTSPDDDWFRAPFERDWWETLFVGGYDIDIGDDELFKRFPGPAYITKKQLTLPVTMKIEMWDSDFMDPFDDQLISTTVVIESFPHSQVIENDDAFIRVNVRSVTLKTVERTYPVPGTEELWYWYEVGADKVRNQYQTTDFDTIRVAVLDTGIDPDVEGLRDKIVFWRDLVNGRTDPYDDEGHGTEVAALVTGNTGGIATNVELIVIKIGLPITIDRIVEGINLAVAQKAKVISMSFGGTERGLSSDDIQRQRDAVDAAYANGVVLVAAAGNEKTSLEIYPAHFENVVSVSALQRFDPTLTYSSPRDLATRIPSDHSYLAFADIFSNYGTDYTYARMSIEISAPGTGIRDFDGRNEVSGGRNPTAGTSFAAPIVSAISAMTAGYAKKKYNVDLSPDQIRRVLRASAVDLGPVGWDPYYGYGLVDAYRALQKVDELFRPTNVDVVLLIDRSGSMGWPMSKINDAKAAAKQFTDLMRVGDKVGVVSFESAVRVEYPLTEIISAETKTAVKTKIDQIYPMGMTAMGDGLRRSYQQLVSYGNPLHPWAVVLMSNGWHNWGAEHPYSVIPDLKSKNIRVYTIGLGAGADGVLLGKIASDTGGFYRFAPTSSDLLAIYNDIAAAVAQEQTVSSTSSSVAQGETVQISVAVDSSVTQATFTISWGGSDLDLTLIRADGALIDANVAAIDPDIEYVEEARYEMYRIWNPMSGTWTMVVTGVYVPVGTETFVAQLTVSTNVILSLSTDKDSYTFPQPVKIIATLEDWGTPLLGASVEASVIRPDTSQIDIVLYDDGSSIHGDDAADDGIYVNYFRQYSEDGSYTIRVTAASTTLTGEAFSREAQKTVLVFGIPTDTKPPKTTMFIGSPQYTDAAGNLYVTSNTPFTLTAVDNNGAGSGVASTAYRIYNATFDTGWLASVPPISFQIAGLDDGAYFIDYYSTDNAGNVEPTNTQPLTLDNTGPAITVSNPPVGWALQDGVTFLGSVVDAGSGVLSLSFSIREANNGEGIPIGFEDLPVSYDPITGEWSLSFDTLLVPDGYYVLHIEAEDNLGNEASTTVPYSIRNWAVIELLPSSEDNKAGRTMPVKFALVVAAEVDPDQPFVYNEELRIEIFATEDPDNVLQESTFGDTARDYRISSVLYITNFKSLKEPMEYTVAVYRNTFDIDSFTFETVK